jgi:hypothetical protein
MINKILLQLEKSASFNKYIGSVYPTDLQGDLKSEVYLILAEKKPEVLQQLITDCKVEQYATMIAKIQIQSANSPFYKKYRLPLPTQRQLSQYEPIDVEVFRDIDDELVQAILSVKGSIIALSKKTGINYSALRTMAKEIAEKQSINKRGIATSITIKVDLRVGNPDRSITAIKSDINKLLNNQLKGVKVKDVLLKEFI